MALQGAPRRVSRPRLQLRRSKRTRSRARGSSRRPSTSVTLGEEARAPRAPAAATAAAATVPCSAAVAEAGPRRVPRPWPTPSAPWPPCLVARASQRATGAPAPSSSPACACGCRWSSSPREPRTSAARSQSSASSARWGEREREGVLPRHAPRVRPVRQGGGSEKSHLLPPPTLPLSPPLAGRQGDGVCAAGCGQDHYGHPDRRRPRHDVVQLQRTRASAGGGGCCKRRGRS